jgi:hypothetical protein
LVFAGIYALLCIAWQVAAACRTLKRGRMREARKTSFQILRKKYDTISTGSGSKERVAGLELVYLERQESCGLRKLPGFFFCIQNKQVLLPT